MASKNVVIDLAPKQIELIWNAIGYTNRFWFTSEEMFELGEIMEAFVNASEVKVTI